MVILIDGEITISSTDLQRMHFTFSSGSRGFSVKQLRAICNTTLLILIALRFKVKHLQLRIISIL